jgi:hypothetical protein
MSKQTIQARMVGTNSVAALGIVVSAIDPVRAICSALVKQGFDPQSSLQIWRDSGPYRLIHRIGDPDIHTNLKGGV